MRKEYKTIREVAGPLMLVDQVEGVKYDELVEIEQSDGRIRRGKVLEINQDKALLQLFEGSQGLRITLSGFAVLCAPAAPESTAFLAGAFRVFADWRCRDNQRQKSGRKFFTAGDTEIIKLRVAQFAKAVRELSILREVAAAPASHYAYLSKGTSMISW